MVSVREKVAYGLGDTASNIIFQTVMLFLSFFYTDIFGISPAVVGVLFLAVRIVDAITDPLMGALTDRTETKYGKFRPYLLWLAIPFAVISILAFTTPELSENGKMIYAFVTYTLLMMAYTAINIPYSALGGVITADPKERVSVQSYRFVFGMLGGLLVTALTIPLVDFLGQGDKAKGYQLTITVMSILGVVLFLLCFAGTKERVHPPAAQQSDFKKELGVLWHNDQWRILCLAAIFVLTGMVMRSTLAIYYVKYYLLREDLITLFVTLGMIGNMLGCACSAFLARRFCKIKLYMAMQLLAATLSILAFFVTSEQVVMAFALYILWCFCLQIGTPLLWAKMADVVDYGHWKSGIRINGLVYSSVVFFIKLGLAIGGAIAGWLLASYGYVADSEQTEAARQGILLSFTLYPAIAFILVALVMKFYTLTERKLDEIHSELPELSGAPQ